MTHNIKLEHEELLWKTLYDIRTSSRFDKSKAFMQHGTTSVYVHSIMVAYTSCYIAEHYNIKVDWNSMIMGALLHDYFLYDWHDRESHHLRPHGFYHPSVALSNATQDFELSPKAQNIIKCHMFPLTLIPPTCKEGWVVCIADKMCSTKETLRR